ncbi:MAG: DUF4249 domain-containing protein [Bacteroidota bacterium]
MTISTRENPKLNSLVKNPSVKPISSVIATLKKVFVLILFIGCIEPYELEDIGSRRVLVIDALVTNLPEEQFVSLTYSYPIDGSVPETASGAQVFVTDNVGNSVEFVEVESGMYQPTSAFEGVVGRSYQLSIETREGERYTSSEEEMLVPANEFDIYGRYIELRSDSSDGFERGVQFLVDVEETNNTSHNYRFNYVEDYEISVPFVPLYEYDEATQLIRDRTLSIKNCYINDVSTDLLIATTSGQVSGDLQEFPVVFVSENDFNLIGQYSLTVRQYRISSAAYQYYKDLQENNESSGSFFDRQKGQLIGNIQNLDDPTDPVVGYFEVASVSERYRIFETGAFEDQGYSAPEILTFCSGLIDTVATLDILAGNISFERRKLWDFVTCEVPLPGTEWCPQALLIPDICSDCRVYGSLEKPAFWD